MSTAPRAWLIDASIYIFRAYFSLPDRWHNAEGMPLNAVYGYANFLLDFLEEADFPPGTRCVGELAQLSDVELRSVDTFSVCDVEGSRFLVDSGAQVSVEVCVMRAKLSNASCIG